jgi:hypothetical protein
VFCQPRNAHPMSGSASTPSSHRRGSPRFMRTCDQQIQHLTHAYTWYLRACARAHVFMHRDERNACCCAPVTTSNERANAVKKDRKARPAPRLTARSGLFVFHEHGMRLHHLAGTLLRTHIFAASSTPTCWPDQVWTSRGQSKHTVEVVCLQRD